MDQIELAFFSPFAYTASRAIPTFREEQNWVARKEYPNAKHYC